MALSGTTFNAAGPPLALIQWLLLALMVALGVNCYTGVQSVGQLSNVYDQLSAARNDLGHLRALQATIVDAETGARGYLLTKDETYLTPYRLALEGLDSALQKGLQRFADEPALATEYQAVVEIVRRKQAHLEKVVGEAGRAGFAAATELIRRDVGLDHMQELREQIDAMETALAARLEATRSRVDANRRQALWSLIGGGLTAIVLIAFVMVIYRRTLKTQQLHRQALADANQSLERQVQDRTRVLRSANTQLTSANEDLESFTYAVSHDLQEPLRKIQAFGDRLRTRSGAELGETGNDYLNRMQSAASRMSVLLNDLLAFSRVSTRGIEPVDVDLQTLAEGVISDLEIAIEESAAVVTLGDLPTIRGDVSQLQQLFQNLLANAVKFKQPDLSPEISISTAPIQLGASAKDGIEIRIKDNGIGFDERYLDRIFTPFQRLHSRDEYSGSGIGLAICRKVCERHGGELDATSTLGHGATFIVRLPLAGPPKGIGTAAESTPELAVDGEETVDETEH